jgi:hypothetical protein
VFYGVTYSMVGWDCFCKFLMINGDWDLEVVDVGEWVVVVE